jgi:hypothetical protein
MSSRLALWVAALGAALAFCGAVRAQTPLLQEVHTLSSAVTPVERELAIENAGSYQLKLTDLRVPAAFTSLKLAVTNGTAVLATVTGNAASPVTVNFDAPAGATLIVRVIGKPATAAGTGSVGWTVTRLSDAFVVQNVVETIGAPPAGLADNQASIDTTFTPTASGNYDVVLTDINVPQALNDLILSVTRVGDSSPLVIIPKTAGTTAFATFSATAGANYHIVALAESDATLKAGLFSVRVRDSSGVTVFSQTQALGRVERLSSVTLAAGPHELVLTDLQFPIALSRIGAAVILNGERAAIATATGTTPFAAAAATYDLYSVAIAAGTSPGSYGIEVRPQGGAPLFSAVKTVGGTTGTTPGYSFIADVPTAGAYKLRLADFAFPASFTAVQVAASQSGALLGTLSASGPLDLPNVAAGKLFIVVLAQQTAGSSGVFGLDLAPAAGGATVFDATQGVGNLFQSRKISVPTAGSYRVTVQDVGFPVAFRELGAVATRGADRLGTVLSGSTAGGSHFDFDATPGNYFVSFVATPDPAENAGTYGIVVNTKPPSPTVTLTATPNPVKVGSTVTLTWTVTNATSCVASDGWSGSRKPADNPFTTAPINTATTFTLACSGDGGTTTKSVTVTTEAQTSGGKRGGGAIDRTLLLGLGLCLVLAASRRRVSGRA